MSDSIFNASHQEDTFITSLRKKLQECDDGSNPDIHIAFQGNLHNNMGFKLRVENVEVYNASLTAYWKEVIQKEGMEAEIESDMTQAVITITCKRILRRRNPLRSMAMPSLPSFSISSIPLASLSYILICSGCIYIEWNRHQDKFLN